MFQDIFSKGHTIVETIRIQTKIPQKLQRCRHSSTINTTIYLTFIIAKCFMCIIYSSYENVVKEVSSSLFQRGGNWDLAFQGNTVAN